MTYSTFSRSHELHHIFKIALPIIAAQLLQVGMGVIDTVMAGRIDALAISAIALGASIWFFVLLIGIGIMAAVTPVIAQHVGADNHPLIREELRQGIWLSISISFCLILLIILIASAMPVLGIQKTIIPAASDYIFWIAWSLPFSCLYLLPRSLNEATGNTLIMMWIQLAVLPINVLGNYIFMYGNFGLPAMGASGAALSTGITQVISCLALYYYTLTDKKYEKYDLRKRMTPPDWRHILQILRLGLPISVAMGMESGLFTTTALLMGRFGVDAAAGHQIAINIASLAFMVPLGVSMALTVRVGQAVGARQAITARQRGTLGIQVCGLITCISAFILWQFGHTIATWYTDDTVVVEIATQLLVMAAIFQIVDGLQVGAIGVLRGFKDTTIPMIIAVFCYWVLGMGTALWFGVFGEMGPTGLWLGLVIGLLFAAIALNVRFHVLTRGAAV
ncbi:MAG: multidrug transporter MATE [Proteobacteria bacterium]|nr:MAG: multidrug transporter MATE [Pseudomonadota bacterium]